MNEADEKNLKVEITSRYAGNSTLHTSMDSVHGSVAKTGVQLYADSVSVGSTCLNDEIVEQNTRWVFYSPSKNPFIIHVESALS